MGFFSKLAGPIGGIAGAVFGGPGGAMAGYQLGSALGGGGRRGGGGGGSAMDAANGYLNQIPGLGKEYNQHFVDDGKLAATAINPLYGQMSSDPNAFLESIMAKYNPSQGYQYKQKEMLQAAKNSAAQGGFAGTENAQNEQARMVQGLLSEDMQEFIKNYLGIQGIGLQGQEGRIDRGFRAGTGLTSALSQNLGSQASLAFQNQRQNNEDRQAYRNNQNGLISNLIGSIASGGGGGGRFPGFGGGGGFFG